MNITPSSSLIPTALRRAYGAAVYLDRKHPGVADRVTEAAEAAVVDEEWTAMRWMVFGAYIRRACADLPAGLGDTYSDQALRTLRVQLALALREAHAAIPISRAA